MNTPITRRAALKRTTGLAAGLGIGLLTALAAVLRTGLDTLSPTPLILVAAVAVSGILWVILATAIATRGPLVDALRAE